MIPIRAGSSQSILIPRRASRSTPRLPSAFINTTVQSPLSTSQVNSSGSVAVTCAAQNVSSAGGSGAASPRTRRYRTRSGESSKSRITS